MYEIFMFTVSLTSFFLCDFFHYFVFKIFKDLFIF